MMPGTILSRELIGAVALVAIALAVPAIAEREPKLATGTLVASDAEALIVRTPDGMASFEVTAETFVPERLGTDLPVSIRYHERDGRRVAAAVTPGPAAVTELGVVARRDAAVLDAGESLPSAAARLPLLALVGTASLAAAYLLRSPR